MIIRVHYTDSGNRKIEQQIELPEGATVGELLGQLGNSFSKKMVVINGQVVMKNSLLQDQSDVYLYSPLAGG